MTRAEKKRRLRAAAADVLVAEYYTFWTLLTANGLPAGKRDFVEYWVGYWGCAVGGNRNNPAEMTQAELCLLLLFIAEAI